MMMTEHTPNTDEVRHYWTVQGIKRASKREKRAAEFDRWLAQVKAEAWDEGARWAAGICNSPDNPYREETE